MRRMGVSELMSRVERRWMFQLEYFASKRRSGRIDSSSTPFPRLNRLLLHLPPRAEHSVNQRWRNFFLARASLVNSQ